MDDTGELKYNENSLNSCSEISKTCSYIRLSHLLNTCQRSSVPTHRAREMNEPARPLVIISVLSGSREDQDVVPKRGALRVRETSNAMHLVILQCHFALELYLVSGHTRP